MFIENYSSSKIILVDFYNMIHWYLNFIMRIRIPFILVDIFPQKIIIIFSALQTKGSLY